MKTKLTELVDHKTTPVSDLDGPVSEISPMGCICSVLALGLLIGIFMGWMAVHP